MTDYTPYGEEWENEMKSHSKSDLIEMIRKIQTGTKDKNLVSMETVTDAEKFCDGFVNDIVDGVIDRDEAFEMMIEYTSRLMQVFWTNAVKHIREKPELLNNIP